MAPSRIQPTIRPPSARPLQLVWLAWIPLLVVQALLVVTLFAANGEAPSADDLSGEESEPAESKSTSSGLLDDLRLGWRGLRSDEPVMSGRHALLQYHGFLAAAAWRDQGESSCYDPAFQAGYPRTPVFDGGSRPAEWIARASGGAFRPDAYKLGLAAGVLIVPVLLGIAAGILGLRGGGILVTGILAMLVCWCRPVQSSLEAGSLDLILSACLGVAALASLHRFDTFPGLGSWLILLATTLGLGLVQPLGLVALVPFTLVAYGSIGARHAWPWHAGLVAALGGTVGVHGSELFAWWTYSWMLTPPTFTPSANSFETFVAAWIDQAWVGPSDHVLIASLIGGSLVGCGLLNRQKDRAVARTFGLGTLAFTFLAVAATYWPDGRRLTARAALPVALVMSILPASFAIEDALGWFRRRFGRWRSIGAAVLVGVLTVSWLPIRPSLGLASPAPLRLGLTGEQRRLVEILGDRTDANARILMEERAGLDVASTWTALLPVYLDRSFLGGIDPEGRIEHGFARLQDHQLAGRSLADWTDAELDAFFRKYNVGWIVAWNSATQTRFRAYPGIRGEMPIHERGAGTLFTLAKASFVLKGQARWLEATPRHVTLADVVPEDGKVVLSLHYQAGMQASPGRVQVEREPDPFDPIPFVRLRMSGPAARITLTWEPSR